MEILSMQFFSALLAIIVIDLVLAGDNAIVIALAARNLPKHLQKRAILWGTVGAIVVRTSLTLIVVWLLQIPGLLFAGGALLIWIAYKLLIPEDGDDHAGKVAATATLWGALRTVVIADTIMGLDNVLAVAGAAHGSFLLVVLGLLVSIPIVIWGSTLILRVVERYPAFVYIGAGVLAWTAVKMMTAEPWLADFFAAHRLVAPLLFFVIVPGVLWLGFARNHRKLESRISARIARFPQAVPASHPDVSASPGESPMLKILVPVDDSSNAQHAVRHVIAEFRKNPAFEVHLLNVQAPFSRHVAQFAAQEGPGRVPPRAVGGRAGAAARAARRRARPVRAAPEGRAQGRNHRRRGAAPEVRPHRARDGAQELAHADVRGVGDEQGPRPDDGAGRSDRRRFRLEARALRDPGRHRRRAGRAGAARHRLAATPRVAQAAPTGRAREPGDMRHPLGSVHGGKVGSPAG